MADNRTDEQQQWFAAIDRDDVAFLEHLWVVLRSADRLRTLTADQLQTRVEAALRARATTLPGDAGAYSQNLGKLMGSVEAVDRRITRYRSHGDFAASPTDDKHFLWITSTRLSTYWRIYVTPMPATAPLLAESLWTKLESVLGSVGMKLSTHEALCKLRDGLVIYAGHASKDRALEAVAQAAAEHRAYFGEDLVRFTRRDAVRVSGLAPDPQSWASALRTAADWFEVRNQDALMGWERVEDSEQMSYTQYVAAGLVGCYLAADPPSGLQMTRNKQPSEVGPAGEAYGRYRQHLATALEALGICPNRPGFGEPPFAGRVTWLQHRLFRPITT